MKDRPLETLRATGIWYVGLSHHVSQFTFSIIVEGYRRELRRCCSYFFYLFLLESTRRSKYAML